jgi:hypothetical protein
LRPVEYDRCVRRLPILLLLLALAVAASASSGSARGTKFVAFKTPSGNIGCIYSSGPDYLRCDIRSGLRPKPPQPQSCGEDYGDSVSMNRAGRARLVCHGDTALDPGARSVAYGTSIVVGPFRCTSRTTGLTCQNPSRHGWFLSRESYRLF